MRIRVFRFSLLVLCCAPLARADSSQAIGELRQVENLAAFSRLYGYIRFFHPSDQARQVDWNRVALSGVEAVRDASDRDQLQAALLRVFQPIAPTLRLGSRPFPGASSAPPPPVTYWQRLGVWLGPQSNIYRSKRIIEGGLNDPANRPLFQPASAQPPLTGKLPRGLYFFLPLALPVDSSGHSLPVAGPSFAEYLSGLKHYDPSVATIADWRVRVADVMIVWNVFQNFHPYLSQVHLDWWAALQPALRAALPAQSRDQFWHVLSKFVALTRDGHGYVFGRDAPGGLPIRTELIQNNIVVTAVDPRAPFQVGDIVERVDGVQALEALRVQESFSSGSPQTSQYRALNRFGEGKIGSTAHIEVRRAGASLVINCVRAADKGGYFFNSITEDSLPPLAEVKPGIFYVNLDQCDRPTFLRNLDKLAAARGVIFDWRLIGRVVKMPSGAHLLPHSDILPHLIDRPIQASPMLIPQIERPDRIGWTYQESTWPVQPATPRFRGHMVFIDDASVVSYGETCMAMVADYHLATLVGGPTAGCNANVNFIPLPGGFRVMWSGMDVRKHDHSSFYAVGFVPDVPVTRTLAGFMAGRDEDLEAAIHVASGAQ